MLVLTRKTDETILIGDNIELKILEVFGNRVKLGIQGDRKTRIVRGELRRIGDSEQASEFWIDASERSAAVPILG